MTPRMRADFAGGGGSMKWSLAAQLRVGFAAALLLVLGIAAAAWWIALTFERGIVRAYETQLRSTVQLAEAQSAFWQLRFDVWRFMAGRPEDRGQTLEEQGALYAIIEERLAAYHKDASSEDERRTLTALRGYYQRYKQVQPKFFELWQAGEKDDANAWLALTVAPFGDETMRAFETQIMLQRSFVERDRLESERKARYALDLVAAITIALAAMLVLGYISAMRMLRPIRALRARAEGIVREQFGETSGASTSKNEVAALDESFQWMSDQLLAHAESLRHSVERLDFLLRATPAVIWTSAARQPFGRTFISANVRALLDYEPEDFLRDPEFWLRNIHPEDRARVVDGLAAIEQEDSHAHEYRFRHKNGSWRWLRADLRVARDVSGVPRELIGYWIDITARILGEKERELVEERLRTALEGGRIAVWEVDAAGKVWLSEQWAVMLGGPKRETWTMFEDLFAGARPADRARILGAAAPVMKGKCQDLAEDVEVRTVTGESRWMQWYARVTERTADGRVARMSGTVFDITARKQAEAEMKLLLERLALVNRLLVEQGRVKTDFMASVTHELRTPLNSVIGFAELLKEEVPGPLNAKQVAFVADILASGRRLLALVEAILEMSRLDAAGVLREREPVEIDAAVEECAAAHRERADARRVGIRVDRAADAGRADLDPKALRRMLDALLDNAIKFNVDGGTVAVSARRTDGWLEIAVADSGIGIAREDRTKLFRPLVQLDAGLARRCGGVGLGLAIARRLAEMHGGTIEVESEPGKGSTFTLRLPVTESP